MIYVIKLILITQSLLRSPEWLELLSLMFVNPDIVSGWGLWSVTIVLVLLVCEYWHRFVVTLGKIFRGACGALKEQ